MKRRMKNKSAGVPRVILSVFIGLFCALLLAAAGYVAYAFSAYYRVEDMTVPETVNNPAAQETVTVGEPYSLMTFNIGFCAYSSDFTFFLDGGKNARAFNRETVESNLSGAAEAIERINPDFLLIQEADTDSDRARHVNIAAALADKFSGYSRVFAQNYDCPYLLWPLTEPHGKATSGMITFSRISVYGALRRSLPVQSGFMKMIDLDRCYAVTRYKTDNGRELCVYNVHLSAYYSEDGIGNAQLSMLFEDMSAEYARGNYVICGGDFNMDLYGNSGEIFGVSTDGYSWTTPFPSESLPEHFRLVNTLDPLSPVASCRNPDIPYERGKSMVLTPDGFIVSDNIGVLSAYVMDEGFAHSDHNPVVIRVTLS